MDLPWSALTIISSNISDLSVSSHNFLAGPIPILTHGLYQAFAFLCSFTSSPAAWQIIRNCPVSSLKASPSPQPQGSHVKEGTSVQVLAHRVCWVTVLNSNITNTLNNTVISRMKMMSTVNCLGPCLLCSPCWEVQLLKAVLHYNIAKILIARQGDEWQAHTEQLKLFQFTLSVKFVVYNKHLCLFWRE